MPTRRGTDYLCPTPMADPRYGAPSGLSLQEMMMAIMERMEQSDRNFRDHANRVEGQMKAMEERMESSDQSVQGLVGRVNTLE